MDCRVDINDFCTLADLWMSEVELDSAYNLSPVEDSHQQQGIINFCDYAIWAQGWDPNDANDINDVNQLQEIQSIWLSEVPSDSAWNLYKGDDSQGHGIINTDDLVIFTENWLRGVLP